LLLRRVRELFDFGFDPTPTPKIAWLRRAKGGSQICYENPAIQLRCRKIIALDLDKIEADIIQAKA
jgi:hypothetical protein